MLPGLHDIAGEPDSFYDEDLVDCPWCDGFHDDDDLCPAMPTEPDGNQISEDDIDWHDWVGDVA